MRLSRRHWTKVWGSQISHEWKTPRYINERAVTWTETRGKGNKVFPITLSMSVNWRWWRYPTPHENTWEASFLQRLRSRWRTADNTACWSLSDIVHCLNEKKMVSKLPPKAPCWTPEVVWITRYDDISHRWNGGSAVWRDSHLLESSPID